MSDPNTRRLLDKIDMLERQVSTQSITIDDYRRKNVRLTRENIAFEAHLGKLSTHAAKQAEKGQV